MFVSGQRPSAFEFCTSENNPMKVKIKRFNKKFPLPKYLTKHSAAFDLYARETVKIMPQTIGYVPLNVAVSTPKNHFLLIAARSSTHKKGLILANGIGIGDPDFSGDGDEYKAAYFNYTNKPVLVEAGERIAQGTFIKFTRVQWKEVQKLGKKNRGGFGSTGTH
jgi:dUTP pyrophosphatase